MKTITSAYKTEMSKVLRHRLTYTIYIRRSLATIVSFGSSDIVNVKTIDSSDPLSRVLPTKAITFSVLDIAGEFNPANPAGTWTRLTGGESVSLSISQTYASGHSLTLTSEVYYLDSQATWNDGIATFTAHGKMKNLQSKQYNSKGAWETDAQTDSSGMTELNTSTSEFMKRMLTSAGLYASEYDVATNTVAPYSRLCPEGGTTTVAEALQLVANMSGQAIWESEEQIHVYPRCAMTSASYVRTLTPRDIISYDVEQADELGTFGINLYAQTTDRVTDWEEILQVRVANTGYVILNVNFDGSLFELSGSANPTLVSSVTMDGFTVTDGYIQSSDRADVLAPGLGITVDQSVSEFKLTPYGFTSYTTISTLTSTGLATLTLRTRKLKRKASRLISTSISGASNTAKALTIDNPLVTTEELATEIKNKVTTYLANKQLLKVKTRGNPELELFDVVKVVTPKDIYYGLLVQRTANYDGTLEDELVLRVISTPTQIKFINRLQTAWYIGTTNTFWKGDITRQNGGVTPVVGDLIYNVCENANGTSDNTLWEVTAVSNFYLTVSSVSITD